MTGSINFSFVFAPEVVKHLRAIDKKYHRLIQETISSQLSYEPLNITRNRKPLQLPAPFGATWELRFGANNCFRVFYEVNEIERVVFILAVGIKNREKLIVGGEEIDL